jgi:hypothetical protein
VQRRFFVKAGEVVQSIPAREFSMYVAISQDGEKVYRFAGFPDAEGDFKRLVSDFQIRAPQSRDAAQSRALYCARVVFGEEPSRWVLSETQARELVSDRLFDHRKDAFSQTARWWQNYRRIHPDGNLNLTTTSTADGAFLTRLPLFWAPIESDVQPELRELQVVVNRDGSCRRVAHP